MGTPEYWMCSADNVINEPDATVCQNPSCRKKRALFGVSLSAGGKVETSVESAG